MSFIHETALIIGDVQIGVGCYVGPLCVIRLDEEKGHFSIGNYSNLQDHVVVHSSGNKIGEFCNIAHHAVIHGSQIGSRSTIYIKSVIDHAIVEEDCFIDAGCYIRDVTIPKGSYVPPHSVIVSEGDLRLIKPISEAQRLIHREVNQHNQQLVKTLKSA